MKIKRTLPFLTAGLLGLCACTPEEVAYFRMATGGGPESAEEATQLCDQAYGPGSGEPGGECYDAAIGAVASAEAVRITPPEPPAAAPDAYGWVMGELDATYNARQCIIDRESRSAGMYTAENPASSASGAYQWLNSSWRNYLPWAEEFYGLVLASPEEEYAGGRSHAAYASPFAQDLVTAFALLHRDLAQNQKPWPYGSCWAAVGSVKELRLDGPEFGPTPHIEAQMQLGG